MRTRLQNYFFKVIASSGTITVNNAGVLAEDAPSLGTRRLHKMKRTFLFMAFFVINLFLSVANSQDLGTTFCWHYNEIYGGHAYPGNQSIAMEKLPAGTHWSVTTEWWENMAEEIDFSGVDFVALLSRGNQPNAPDKGNGNPKHIPKLVDAMDARGANFKLAIFDDCPNSWTGSMNWDQSGGTAYSTDSPKFDCSNTSLYKYIWDYNLKQAIGNIPDSKRYKIDGRMVIFFWSAKPAWMTNLQGNLSKILQYIKNQCQATYGFVPYLIVDKDWLDNDNTLSTATVDGVHGWFSSGGNIPYTLETWNGRTYGALCPGIRTSDAPDYIDPSMGTTDHGKRLKTSLTNTVSAGARTTLVEGFTDAAENAALWRSNDNIYYDYPNQRLNILRRYTSNPYPSSLKVEAEACDSYSDLTTGNSGGAFLYSGDLDVVKCSDALSGWNVTSTQANEWMEWKELPLLTNTKFQLRYKSSATASVKFSVDGTALSTISLPSTNDAWTTIDAGTYTTVSNSLHTVRLTIVSGTPDINYFLRVADVTATNGAQFVSQSGVPSTMTPGQTATVGVTMKNTGTTTWTSTDLYKLGSQPGGSSTWGFTRVNLGSSDNIAPNATKTFTFTITAPTTTGTYNFQTKMVQENVEWFGDVSTNVAIVVAPAGNTLTVTNGTGGGTYTSGTVVSIAANAPASGKVFNKWTINSGAPSIADLYDATTTLTMPATAAAVTATYSNYLDACDAITGWNTPATLYTTDKKEGTGCLQSVGSTTDEFKKAFTTAFNPNIPVANASLKFWYYVSDVTKFNSTNQVELGSGGAADANEYNWSLTGLVNGWNRIDLKFSSANVVGSPNLNAINWFRIYHQKNGSVTTRVDAIEISGITSSSKSLHLDTNPEDKEGLDVVELTIYPNPLSGESNLTINVKSPNASSIKILTLKGQVIYSRNINGETSLSLPANDILKSGLYIVSLTTKDAVINKKLIVK